MNLTSHRTARARLLAALAGAVVLASATSAARADGRILYVDDDAVSGGSGRSWRNAIRILQDALEIAATEGDVAEIRVAEGVYTPDDGEGHVAGSRRSAFELTGAVIVIRGGYAGLRYRTHDAWDPDRYLTLLSGDLAGDDRPGFLNRDENSYHVVRVRTEDDGPGTLLEGFWIVGGHANGLGAEDASGGGLLADHGNVHLSFMRFLQNYAAGYGGAFASQGGAPSVSDSTFESNEAGAYGGAIAFEDDAPFIERSVFRFNTALSHGGAITFRASAPDVRDSIFEGNSALESGGAIAGHYSSTNLFNSIFHGNAAGWGGALASGFGGDPVITNVTFFANMAERGGALHLIEGGAAVTNCILWNNRDATDDLTSGQIHGSAKVNFSLLEGGWEGAGGLGIVDDDPRFAGGPLDLSLAPGSPAIDAGDNGAVLDGTKEDLAGNPRFRDDPKTPDSGERRSRRKVPIVDLGAYEYQAGVKK